MATARILESYSQSQKTTLDGSEYLLSLWSRSTALNYPVVGIVGNRSKIPLFLEKISFSGQTAGVYEVFAVNSIAAIAAPANSSFRYFNKRFITGNVSQEFTHIVGEITPGQYAALVFNEDIFTFNLSTGDPRVIDFSNSNILLQGDPKIASPISAILVLKAQIASELFATFEAKQIHPLTNNI